jgi:membrane protein DedA with SNARE-associated domain
VDLEPVNSPDEDSPTARLADAGDSEAEVEDEVIVADQPKWRFVALVAFVGLVVCTQFANAVWARWLDTRPEQLLMLSSRLRYLLLVTSKDISFAEFFVIGAVRLFVAAMVCYSLGWAFNTRVVWFFTRFLGMSRSQVNQMQDAFATAKWILIPWFAGSNVICAIAGITRTPPKRFAALVGAGIAVRLVLVWIVGDVFSDQIDSLNKGIARFQMPLLIVSIVMVVVVNGRNLIRGERD